jgi:hypothetical protein
MLTVGYASALIPGERIRWGISQLGSYGVRRGTMSATRGNGALGNVDSDIRASEPVGSREVAAEIPIVEAHVTPMRGSRDSVAEPIAFAARRASGAPKPRP